MSIVISSLGSLIVGFAGLLAIVAYDRWEHRRRQDRARMSGPLHPMASRSLG